MEKHSVNQLLKVKAVCEMYQEWKEKGYTNRWIHKNKIAPAFYISENTLYAYLRIPYKRLLKEIGHDTDSK